MSLVIKRKTFIFNKILSSIQLAQFRQRKAQTNGQNGSKKQKKRKKTANIKDEESIRDGIDTDRSQGDETSTCSSRRGAAATADFAIIRTLHSGEIIKHSQTYTIEVSLSQAVNSYFWGGKNSPLILRVEMKELYAILDIISLPPLPVLNMSREGTFYLPAGIMFSVVISVV